MPIGLTFRNNRLFLLIFFMMENQLSLAHGRSVKYPSNAAAPA